ncbi:MAG TPA: response regulator [Actinomycetota bacterium]|nr:response regulator [Actinomycetota bacterium]
MARVFVVDDNADVRHVIIYSLMDGGHDVTTLKDGEAALEALLNEPPDVLVLDIMMPGYDGFEVLQQMQSWGLRDTTRTIVLTARASDNDRKRALEAGADEFMRKPFDPEELASKVEELLSVPADELASHRARRVAALQAAGDS